MKIIRLTAENVKRLRAVQIEPDGNTVVIAGRNAQGKSSVLDAIWMALAGAAGAKETSRPIRDGADHATVTLDLGDLIVTRRWGPGGTTLEVAARDGARYSSPQTVLDGLVGRLSFDPLAFAEQDAKGQLATLLSVVDLPFDPAELAAGRQAVYDERTDVNREAKRVETQLAAIASVPAETPDELVNPAEIAAELELALGNKEHRAKAEAHLADVGQRAARIRAMLAEAEEIVVEAEAAFQKAPEATDPEPIRARLAGVEAVNEAVRAKGERRRLEAELKTLTAQSAERTKTLAEIDQGKAKAIADARMPLEELSFDEEGVLYQGVPFSQASASERLRVGIAMAMALNPTIRVIRITDGSLLDSENLALIDEMAAEHDFQIWLERVDDSGTVGITIEDGQVASEPVEVEAVAS